LLALAFLFVSCTEVKFENPDDPDSPNYRGAISSSAKISSSSVKSSSSSFVSSSSFAIVSSSSVAVVLSSSSVTYLPSSSSTFEISSSSAMLSSSSLMQSSSSSTWSSSSVIPSSSSLTLSSSSVMPSSSSSSIKSIVYGDSLTYQGEIYKTVVIGSQTWFQRNLNYAFDGSKCNDNDPANCTKYGRLYDWATAKKVCPSGWHLPSEDEWNVLIVAVGGFDIAGRKLKAQSGWTDCGLVGSGSNNICEDAYGFAALPGGDFSSAGNFGGTGRWGYWWSATNSNTTLNANFFDMLYSRESVSRSGYDKKGLMSVRCLKDD